MAKLFLYHSGIVLFVNFKARALLPDVRCGHSHGAHDHGSHGDHQHPAPLPMHVRDADGEAGACCVNDPSVVVEPHFPHIRFLRKQAGTDSGVEFFPFLDFEGINPLTGLLEEFRLIQLHRQAVTLGGQNIGGRLRFDSRTPGVETPGESDRDLYYWVSNPQRFTPDSDITVRPEFLDRDPAHGIAGYVDVPFGAMRPFFGRSPISTWSFRPRSRGNRDHQQALAQVVVKEIEVTKPFLDFRTFGDTERSHQIFLNDDEDVHVFVGNTTRGNMMLRPTGLPRSPDHHFGVYYDYLCPAQTTRPLPHLQYRTSGPPEIGGSNCPPMDPPPPPPPPP
jgi:hypothetical protein